MLKIFARTVANVALQLPKIPGFSATNKLMSINRPYSSILSTPLVSPSTSLVPLRNPLSQVLQSFPLQDQTRTVTKFSRRSGKRKTIRAVVKRFYRLDWGIWIRTRTGRHKKLWKKGAAQRARLREHCFVNGTQSWFLDKCVTKFWRKPKYYINDIYEPYHERPEFFVTKKTKLVK